ncbi:MAG: alpha/beta hydrolase [Verrucomicrobia bacterium]|nr:alpha/beta hydrolase [Verrucomicrobiota bacterium]
MTFAPTLRALAFWGTLCLVPAFAAAPAVVLNVWPGTPPGETKPLPPEADQTKDTDKLIAGRRIIKLGNVSTPQLAVFRPAPEKDTGASVIICPGGGFNILAYDLEGTEVAAWLNSLGVTGIVLKYRVPARDPQKRWLAAVQDAQRSVSLVRHRAAEWKLDPGRIGILGFSAGGATAGITALAGGTRHYDNLDAIDTASCRPDFALLIYPAYFVERGQTQLRPDLVVPKDVPPTFFVHAFDDGVPVQNSLLLAAEIKRVGGTAEVHAYDAGGHGYGLRLVPELPVTTWPARAEAWLARRGLLAPSAKRP